MLTNLDEAKLYIQQLNLGYIVEAMCADTYPLPRWVKPEAEYCAQLYKNFLWLNRKHPSLALVPTREIDEFWHNHILYTKNYIRDCMKIFGHYFHHEPSMPEEDPNTLAAIFVKTKELYFSEFGQNLGLIST
jgi:hypothetical protein